MNGPHTQLRLLLTLLVAAGCSDDPAFLKPLGQDAKFLAFGDSLTYGTGTDAGQSYPAVLARLSGDE